MHRLLIQLGIDARLSPAQAETLSEALTECGTAKADYLDLQRQHEELKTMLFNERQNAKELAAQVEQLRNGVFHFNRTHGDLNPLLKAVSDTPAQCLAEIKAQAGRDGFIAGVNETGQGYNGEHGLSDDKIIDLAEIYVTRKLRQSAKAGSGE